MVELTQAAESHTDIYPWWGGFADRYSIHANATRTAVIVLSVLLAFDVASIVLESVISLMLEWNPGIDRRPFHAVRIDTEFGVWALIGYAKLATALALLALIFRMSGERAYAILAVAFAYLLADDMLLLHERFARLMAANVDLPFSLPVVSLPDADIWELMYFASVGPAILALLGWAAYRAGAVHRSNVVIVAGLVLMVGFFAVVIDFADQIADQFSRYASKFLGLIEDAGENMLVSLTIAFLIMVRARLFTGEPRPDLR